MFIIMNNTFVEIRDCMLTSKNTDALRDCSFIINQEDLESNEQRSYRGILSIKSCTIKNFSYAVMAGSHSIVSIELSYLNNCRDTGIYSVNPKMLKITGTVFDNEPGSSLCNHGIQIFFKPDPTSTLPSRKILIEENKINYC
jgi:hypothetical protein